MASLVCISTLQISGEEATVERGATEVVGAEVETEAAMEADKNEGGQVTVWPQVPMSLPGRQSNPPRFFAFTDAFLTWKLRVCGLQWECSTFSSVARPLSLASRVG